MGGAELERGFRDICVHQGRSGTQAYPVLWRRTRVGACPHASSPPARGPRLCAPIHVGPLDSSLPACSLFFPRLDHPPSCSPSRPRWEGPCPLQGVLFVTISQGLFQLRLLVHVQWLV